MIKKFLRVFTGYKIKEMSINGVKTRTRYRGKMPTTSPLLPMKELKVKLFESPTAKTIKLDFSKCWEDRLEPLKDIPPSSVSRFEITETKFCINRYVTKQNKSPLSTYTFSANDKVFALFYRVYDYGNYFKEIDNYLCANFDLPKSAEEVMLHHVTDGRYSAVVDVFGHSQGFIWNDQEKLETCLAAI